MVEHNQSANNPTNGGYNNAYKFNGKELDDATGMYYYGARYYDPRISIFVSVDPAAEEYRDVTPYAYVANNPVNAIDPDGKRIIYTIEGRDGKKGSKYLYRNGNFYDKNNRLFIPNEKNQATMYKVWKSYQKIEKSNSSVLKGQLRQLETSKEDHFVVQSKHGNNHVEDHVNINSVTGKPTGTTTRLTLGDDFDDAFETVVHEMRHQFDYDIGNMKDADLKSSYKDPAEIRAVYNENIAREMNGKGPRTEYGGEKINSEKLRNPPNNTQCDDL